ncbi:transcription elongation factor B polypeptide [Thalictrum thalictroides]|uniref:Transcription elongation factor B polypeptide n=1 Tax=Thalictrum thalictroides TaxID=46969 RepID=A0A7J6V2D6_THATH|nr:transcription elongation factor B polypeptide [Thalictrum thalictroides]
MLATLAGERSPDQRFRFLFSYRSTICKFSIVKLAIDNVRYLGDVGETDIDLLRDILPHCTSEQLMRIEKSTEGRDLSPVTNKLWRNFFEKDFGIERLSEVWKEERQKKRPQWRRAYENELKECDKKRKLIGDKLKKLYSEEANEKQSRQVQICSKIPPSSNKRNFYGGSGSYNKFSNTKGRLMKKAKMEYLNSHEAKVHLAMRKNALQSRQRAPLLKKSVGSYGKESASSSEFTKPWRRS